MNTQAIKSQLIQAIEKTQSETLLGKLQRAFSSVTNEIQKNHVSSLTKEETSLLLKINEGLPEETQLRYSVLNEKLLQETLSDEEHQELKQLIPLLEAKNVERLGYLAQLSKLWNLTLDETMERLGIKTPPVIHG